MLRWRTSPTEAHLNETAWHVAEMLDEQTNPGRGKPNKVKHNRGGDIHFQNGRQWY